MNIHFILLQNFGNPKKFSMKDGDVFIIGRDSEKSDISVEDESCSGQHCRISYIYNKITIQDLGSKNGLFINGARVSKTSLGINDKVSLGNSSLYLNSKVMKKSPLAKNAPSHLAQASDNLEILSGARDGNTKLLGRRNNRNKDNGRPYKLRSKKLQIVVDFLSNFIDLLIAVAVLSIVIYAVINRSPELLQQSRNQNFIVFLFSSDMITSTGVSIICTFVIHKINKKMPGGSVGQRIFKIRKDI